MQNILFVSLFWISLDVDNNINAKLLPDPVLSSIRNKTEQVSFLKSYIGKHVAMIIFKCLHTDLHSITDQIFRQSRRMTFYSNVCYTKLYVDRHRKGIEIFERKQLVYNRPFYQREEYIVKKFLYFWHVKFKKVFGINATFTIFRLPWTGVCPYIFIALSCTFLCIVKVAG